MQTSVAWKRYLAFVLWGCVHGAIAYLMWLLLWDEGQTPHALDGIVTLGISMVGGGAVSAVVFILLFKTPRWLEPFGFLIVGALLPFVAIAIGASLHDQRFEIPLGSIAMLLPLAWTTCSLPFAFVPAIASFFAWRISTTKREKAQSSPSIKTESD